MMPNENMFWARARLRILLLGLLFSQSLPLGAETLLLTSDRLLDVSTGRMSQNVQVLVVDGKIASINPDLVPAEARLIELGDRTLLPGLIDSHVHLTSSGANFRAQILTENAAEAALRGAQSAQVTLMAGFTTVRDLAQLIPSSTLIAVALGDASNKGWIVAPRIITAGHALSITGGQIDPSMWVASAEGLLELGPAYGIADGIDEVIKATRYQIKHGARVIKMAVTAGIMMQQEGVAAQQYSEAEIRAVVEEAGRHGIRVAAHAMGAKGINAAVRAGVASIEHGWMLDNESIRLMKKNGTYLVPTTSMLSRISFDNMPASVRAKAEVVFPLAKQSLINAFRSGVKVAMGSDASMIPHGENATEIVAMVDLGMAPLQAIQAATLNAADLLGKSDRGRVEVGLLADLTAVDGNPLEDITTLLDVVFVMKGGEIYKQP
ncbi:MAG: amidohydrolase family protein [Gammaproteobacteria bacterium]|nr:amidohydrolase family protein [Gammaproteobacteria bacterium]